MFKKSFVLILIVAASLVLSACGASPTFVLNGTARDSLYSVEPRGADYVVLYLTHADDAFCMKGKSNVDGKDLIAWDGELVIQYHTGGAMTGDGGCNATESEGSTIYVIDSIEKVPNRSSR